MVGSEERRIVREKEERGDVEERAEEGTGEEERVGRFLVRRGNIDHLGNGSEEEQQLFFPRGGCSRGAGLDGGGRSLSTGTFRKGRRCSRRGRWRRKSEEGGDEEEDLWLEERVDEQCSEVFWKSEKKALKQIKERCDKLFCTRKRGQCGWEAIGTARRGFCREKKVAEWGRDR
jgi:hypothetical protein